MRMLVTKVKRASLSVDDKLVSKITEGYVVYLGVKNTDTEKIIEKCVDKLLKLRIFHDENDKLNLAIDSTIHQILVVSQFTLYGNAKDNNRPSFTNAARPELAKPLYEYFVKLIKDRGFEVQTGVFGAHMEIDAIYQGPFNLMYELED